MTPDIAASLRPPERWDRTRDQAEHLAAQLPPLLVAPEILTSATTLGVHGRRKAGMGESFWQFRHYRHEDSAAAVDWRQSAKSQHLYVREREWEAAEAVWFWRDASPGMRYASSAELPAKVDRASVLALALAALLIRGGERIGVLGSGAPPGTGRIAFNRIARTLHEMAGDEALPPDLHGPRRHGILVWLSDFYLPLETLEGRMRALAYQGVQGFLVQIADPAEEDFPFEGRVRFEMPGQRLDALLGRAETARSEYRARLQAHIETVGQMARRAGWSFTRHRTDRSPQVALIALYAALGGARVTRRGF